MEKKMNKVCIYPKDIQRITGKSYRKSTRLIQKTGTDPDKMPNEFLTIEEFCSYSRIKYEQLTHLIFDGF